MLNRTDNYLYHSSTYSFLYETCFSSTSHCNIKSFQEHSTFFFFFKLLHANSQLWHVGSISLTRDETWPSSALGVQTVSHGTIREVLNITLLIIARGSLILHTCFSGCVGSSEVSCDFREIHWAPKLPQRNACPSPSFDPHTSLSPCSQSATKTINCPFPTLLSYFLFLLLDPFSFCVQLEPFINSFVNASLTTLPNHSNFPP